MDEVHRAGHLICERKGTHGKRVLLIGHKDTVFESDSPFQKFVINGNTAAGPGSSDMKGGLVIILSALKALNENHALDDTNSAVFLSGDEEHPGEPLSIARRDPIEAGKQSDATLEFEGGVQIQGHDAASIARRSAYQWILTTSGKSAHSSGVFGKNVGDGAIYELGEFWTSSIRICANPTSPITWGSWSVAPAHPTTRLRLPALHRAESTSLPHTRELRETSAPLRMNNTSEFRTKCGRSCPTICPERRCQQGIAEGVKRGESLSRPRCYGAAGSEPPRCRRSILCRTRTSRASRDSARMGVARMLRARSLI